VDAAKKEFAHVPTVPVLTAQIKRQRLRLNPAPAPKEEYVIVEINALASDAL
jgi:hypothetical protein